MPSSAIAGRIDVAWAIIFLVIALLAVLVLLLIADRLRDHKTPGRQPPVIDPADLIPSTLDERSLPGYLGVRLRGPPSSVSVDAVGPDGIVVLADAAAAAPGKVVWVDGGDEALVHLDSMTTRITGSTLVVSVDLETDQTGRAPVIVRIALGGAQDPAGLVATTDQIANGHPVLVSRWGPAVQDAVWSSVVTLGADHAQQRGGVAGRVAIDKGRVLLQARSPITLHRVERGP